LNDKLLALEIGKIRPIRFVLFPTGCATWKLDVCGHIAFVAGKLVTYDDKHMEIRGSLSDTQTVIVCKKPRLTGRDVEKSKVIRKCYEN
jgi:hypothetical protein